MLLAETLISRPEIDNSTDSIMEKEEDTFESYCKSFWEVFGDILDDLYAMKNVFDENPRKTAEDMIEEMSLSDGVQDNMKILPSIEEIGRGVQKRISYLAN